MEGLLPVLIQLVSGALGGNVAGKAMKNLSLGTLWNSVVGILGGGIGGQQPFDAREACLKVGGEWIHCNLGPAGQKRPRIVGGDRFFFNTPMLAVSLPGAG